MTDAGAIETLSAAVPDRVERLAMTLLERADAAGVMIAALATGKA